MRLRKGVSVKKSISNRDVERIALNAKLTPEQVRAALAMRNDVVEEVHARVTGSAQELNYSITVRDRVAMAAGTSVATVNRAYRPDARHLVRPQVLHAIEREAYRLGYKPDPVAQSRRTSHSSVVAICPEMRHLANPYHTALIRALSEAVTERGLTPVITPIPAEWQLPDIAQSNITGLVILWEGERTDQQVAALRAAGREAVLIGYHDNLPSVAPDWTDAYEQLTHRALDQSYTTMHLGYFTERRWSASARLEGVARALQTRSHQPRIRLWIEPDFDVQRASDCLEAHDMTGAAQLLRELSRTPGSLERRPRLDLNGIIEELCVDLRAHGPDERTALLGYSDVVIRRLMQQLSQSGHQVHLGEDLGLAGHDNLEPMLNDINPVLTTIDYSLADMADRAMTTTGQPRSFQRVPTQVIVRESL